MIRLLSSVWKSWSPLRVKIFSWQLVQDRILTCQNRFSRKIIVDLGSISFVFYDEHLESVCHLFVRCSGDQVSYHVFRWLECEFVLPSDLSSLFSILLRCVGGRDERLGFLLVCQIVAWSFQRSRNAHIFLGASDVCAQFNGYC